MHQHNKCIILSSLSCRLGADGICMKKNLYGSAKHAGLGDGKTQTFTNWVQTMEWLGPGPGRPWHCWWVARHLRHHMNVLRADMCHNLDTRLKCVCSTRIGASLSVELNFHIRNHKSYHFIHVYWQWLMIEQKAWK